MAKYINADELIKALEKYMAQIENSKNFVYTRRAIGNMQMLVDRLPSADVVESKDLKDMFDFHKKMLDEGGYAKITRCKDCKYCDKLSGADKYEGDRFSPTDLGCKVHNEYVYADDYCSYAERKEAENG